MVQVFPDYQIIHCQISYLSNAHFSMKLFTMRLISVYEKLGYIETFYMLGRAMQKDAAIVRIYARGRECG